MDNIGIKLFKSDGNDIVLPNVSDEELEKQEKLVSQSIENAIGGQKVKTLIIPEDTRVDKDNIVFDFSDMETISIFQKEALKSLISSSGNVSIYLYKKNTLVKVGMGDRYGLERLIPVIKESVFGEQVKVFKDFAVGKPVIEMNKKDITQLRMNL